MEKSSDESSDYKQKRKTIFTMTFLLHVFLLAYCVFVHVHESSLLTVAASIAGPERHFPGALEFPGRWKYLTIINLHLQTLFFCFSLFGHFLPDGKVQKIYKWFIDTFFTTIVFPTTFLICAVFWPIFLMDSNSIYPDILRKLLPSYLNHIYHTAIAVTVLLELLTVCHHYPGTLLGLFIMGSFNFAYLCVMIYCVLTLGTWPYPFINKLPPPGLLVFFGISFLIYVAVYYIGKMLCHLRWGVRLRLMKTD